MDKKEDFKNFVKKNPKLINYVKDGSSSWQKFYELYDLYGESDDAWKSYLKTDVVVPALTGVGLTDLVGWLKNLDLDNVQTGINNLQRVIGVVQDLSTKNTSSTKDEYKPRPVYKHFED